MKILYIIDNLGVGGKERQLIEIIKGLKNFDLKVGVITFNKNKYFSKFVEKKADFFKELSKRPTRFEPFFTIWKCFKYFQPDIVHTWDTLSSFYAYLPIKIFNVKFIDGSIRDSGTDKRLSYYFKRFFLEKADLIISNSEAGLRYYRVKGKVLYNVIDFSRFYPQKKINHFNIVMVANFTDFKDHTTFIKASIKLIDFNIVDKVFLIGDGIYKRKIEQMIPSEIKDRLIFTGQVANVEEYLSECKVGVLCSTRKYQEGISNSVLEYLAADLIVVATKVGAIEEIIIDKYNGFLVTPEDPKSLFEIIKYVRENFDKLNYIKLNAKAILKEKFDYSKNIIRLIEIYSNLINKSE